MSASEATEMGSGPEDVPEVVVETVALSDVGCVRAENQDGFLFGDLDRGVALLTGGTLAPAVAAAAADDGGPQVPSPPAPASAEALDTLVHRAGQRGLLWVVCDGMGGAAAGEVASEMAARAVWDEMREAQATTERVVYGRLLRRAVRAANLRIWEHAREHSRLRGMGTTLSAAGLVGNAVILAQIGDSRAYVARGDQLVQVTRDQSLGAALVNAGRMTPEQVQSTPHAHTVLQALGVQRDVEVALSIVRIRRGDRLLLCSDGLYGPLGDDGLRALLGAHDQLDQAVEAMVTAARAAGGPDNITAVLIRFDGAGLRPARPDDRRRFVELDPMEEGDRALVTTSRVARRLAAQFGLDEDPGPPVVPATGQHRARSVPPELQAMMRSGRPKDEPEVESPDETAPAPRSRIGVRPLLVAALLVLVAVAWLGWTYL